MRKVKLVVSDFHLGKGRTLPDGSRNILEDFFYDAKFVEFLDYHRNGEFAEAEVELICNGDFFNHLHVDIREPNPDVISERVALFRTVEILKGHPEIFEAMRKFGATPGHRITFILGNHDPGLLFPAVVKKLRGSIGDNLQVKLGAYLFDGVHVEHGNQYFADNAYNQERFFLSKHLAEPIVNLPWGSFFVIHLLDQVRRDRPYFSKIYPFKYYLRWALIHETLFALKTIGRIACYFVWLRFRKDPHRRSSLARTVQIIKEVGISPDLNREAKKILLTQQGIRIVIFGHTHHAVIRQFAPDKTYVNTGLWNEQVSLELTDPGKVVRLTYAQLDYADGVPQASLKEWRGTWRVIEELD